MCQSCEEESEQEKKTVFERKYPIGKSLPPPHHTDTRCKRVSQEGKENTSRADLKNDPWSLIKCFYKKYKVFDKDKSKRNKECEN